MAYERVDWRVTLLDVKDCRAHFFACARSIQCFIVTVTMSGPGGVVLSKFQWQCRVCGAAAQVWPWPFTVPSDEHHFVAGDTVNIARCMMQLNFFSCTFIPLPKFKMFRWSLIVLVCLLQYAFYVFSWNVVSMFANHVVLRQLCGALCSRMESTSMPGRIQCTEVQVSLLWMPLSSY